MSNGYYAVHSNISNENRPVNIKSQRDLKNPNWINKERKKGRIYSEVDIKKTIV